MRMIDADALIKRLDYCVSQGLGGNIAYMFGHMVDEAPTVDAVPVIRCKDCKWAVKCYGDVVMVDKYGEEIHEPLGMNGYCSMAERKEE